VSRGHDRQSDQPVVVLIGEDRLLISLEELYTIAAEDLNTVFVFNNDDYGITSKMPSDVTT
jgi:thiamine pyrophosphate-dependent acetolactate synthase large subunit-like protein